MSKRRSRSPRGRKAGAPVAQPQDVGAVAPPADRVSVLAKVAPADPTETAQLRALEAGWDELLA
jgi:hypothetical protein